MPRYYQAIALDYDGTLTGEDHPGPEVLAALAQIRGHSVRTILVSGRVFSDLCRVFPQVDDWFDYIVAENGAVLRHRGVSRAVTAPVPIELDGPLVDQGIAFTRGQVLLACAGEHEITVLKELRRIGSDCQLIRNRDALMVLPAGVSKGSGVLEALEELGLSYHNVVAVGDAENDLALLDRCELRVAVANAVASLRNHADIVLQEPNGQGVIEFLNGPLFREDGAQLPGRWRITLGTSPAGDVVTLPASWVNVLVIGGSGAGKSYMAGLMAERLLELREEREQSGLPHWVIVDEAHVPFGAGSIACDAFRGGEKGICLVTYAPQRLCVTNDLEFDYIIALAGNEGLSRDALGDVEGILGARASGPLPTLDKGQGLLVHLGNLLEPQVFDLGSRWLRHVRHWHKYAEAHLPWEKAFRFARLEGPTGAVADNLLEFRRELLRCDPQVVLHHLANRDFSRWIDGVLGDQRLAQAVREVEETFDRERSLENPRQEIAEAIENRYLA
ncbi:MAG: HAD-IIB family hydrolase [Polyangiales bacterium]